MGQKCLDVGILYPSSSHYLTLALFSVALFKHYTADVECTIHSACEKGNEKDESENISFFTHRETTHEQTRFLLSGRDIMRMGTSLFQSHGSSHKEWDTTGGRARCVSFLVWWVNQIQQGLKRYYFFCSVAIVPTFQPFGVTHVSLVGHQAQFWRIWLGERIWHPHHWGRRPGRRPEECALCVSTLTVLWLCEAVNTSKSQAVLWTWWQTAYSMPTFVYEIIYGSILVVSKKDGGFGGMVLLMEGRLWNHRCVAELLTEQ